MAKIQSTKNIGSLIKDLTQVKEFPCISIFLPVEKSWDKHIKNKLNLKSLLGKVHSNLIENKIDKEKIAKVLRPVEEFLQKEISWESLDSGLIIYLSPSTSKIIKTYVKLEQSYHIGHCFDLKPLFLICSEQNFHLLWLSPNQVKMYRVINHFHKQVKVEDMPESIDIITKYTTFEKSRQMHQVSRSAEPTHVRHGHGGIKDYNKKMLKEFIQIVESAVTKYMKKNQQPLVVTGPVQILSLYENANHYSRAEYVSEPLTDENQMPQFIESVQKFLKTIKEKSFVEKVNNISPHLFSKKDKNIANLVKLAHEGRLSEVYVDTSYYLWGTYDVDNHSVQLHKDRQTDSEDLINVASVETLLHGGECLPLPNTKVDSNLYAVAIER